MRVGMMEDVHAESWLEDSRASIRAIAASALRRARRLIGADDGDGLDAHLARIVHDLRQPLTTLSASLDMIALALPTSTHVDRCRRAVKRQRELIDDLLVLTSKLDLRETVDLEVLLEEIVDDLEPAAHKRRVELLVDVRAEPLIRGNRLALQRALSNVVTNAIEMTRERSHVEILLGRDRRVAFIEVRDHGPGVAPELRDRVFEPFFTTRRGGTGLGLAITRAAVKAHRGTVRFVDATGGCVRFELPYAERHFTTSDANARIALSMATAPVSSDRSARPIARPAHAGRL